MKIDVLGVEYTVFLEPDPDSIKGGWAHVDPVNQEIAVWSGLSEDQQREAVLHELVHLADEAPVGHQECIDEKAVTRIAACLFAIVKHNKKVVKWLMGGKWNGDT